MENTFQSKHVRFYITRFFAEKGNIVNNTFHAKSKKENFFDNFSKEMVKSKMLIAHYLLQKDT